MTDNGTGDYTVAFDTSFSDTNYWLTGFGRYSGDSSIHMGALSANSSASKTAGAIRLKSFSVGGGSAGADDDLSELGMMFWGDYT